MKMVLKIVLVLALIACCSIASDQLVDYVQANDSSISSNKEVLYLPDGRGLNLLSFGYNNLVADLLWFNTINYFGKHFHTDQNYQWLGHMCDLVTSLDSKAKYVYEFCSTMLSWEANLPNDSLKVLDKAVSNFPQDWKFLYLRGFTEMFFLKNDQAALADFTSSARLPGASWIAARLAAKKIALSDDPKSAVEFLQEILKGTSDPIQRQALEGRLREAQLVADLDTLAKAVLAFKAANNRFPLKLEELVNAGIIPTLPLDPFGGRYLIDESGNVDSTSSKKLPRFLKRRS
jgi:hypothetical protein